MKRVRNPRKALRVQGQPIEHRRAEPLLLPCREISGIGGQNVLAPRQDLLRGDHQGPILVGRPRRSQHACGFAGAAPEILHLSGDLTHGRPHSTMSSRWTSSSRPGCPSTPTISVVGSPAILRASRAL